MLRKTRLPTACALAGVLAIVVLAGAQAKRATSAAARYMLNIDGASTALVSFKGGGVFADVVSEANGEKRPGPPRAEAIVIGVPVTGPLSQQLVSSMWSGDGSPRNGSIVSVDVNGNAVSERQFTGAVITEVSLPACDAARKEAGSITITLAPEQITTTGGSGKVSSVAADKATESWIASSFRLEIDGVDCTKVTRVEPLVARRAVQNTAGTERIARKQSGGLEVANVRISFAAASTQSWQKWFDDLVIKGDPSQEKSGTLTLLGRDLKTELAVIRLHNLGIVRLSPEGAEGSQDSVPRVTAELYCERLELVNPAKP